jgi:methylenetetrahydrofolate reductase (NADPH)
MTDSATTPGGVVSSGTDQQQREALSQALRRPRYEVLPLAGTADQVEQHVPRDLPVTVTASPRQGIEATLALTDTLARRGFEVVPHLAARLVRDEAQLSEILHRLEEADVRDVFAFAGEGARPVGDFTDSLALLTAMQRLRQAGVGRRLERVGVAGYPQGHPIIADEELTRALHAKQPLSSYLVSQMCFDPRAVSAWVTQMMELGLRMPVHLGVAGVVDQRRLLRIATRIGVGSSAQFLRKHRYGLVRLALPGGYRPDRLLRQLAVELAEPARPVVGLHIYTLGDVAATERWRRRALAELTGDEPRNG